MRQITLYLFTVGVLLACVSAELQHRQRENFHYSSSSKKIVNGNVVDEDDKSGFQRKQTGNMGGNYEESENMDVEARRKMEEMMRLSREGMSSHTIGGGAAPALGPMGIPTFMTGGTSGHHHLHSGALTSGVLVDDCDVTGASHSSHQNMNAASSQFARTGTLVTPLVRPVVVQPVVHRSESASHYSARSETGATRVAPVATLLIPASTSYVAAADSERYRDANRRAAYVPVMTPVDTVHSSSQQHAAQDRYAASESRRYPTVYQPTVLESEAQAAAMQQQYSRSQVVEPQRSYPVSYTSGSHAAEQQGHSSQYHARDERRYDSTHDDVNRRRGGSSYVAPVQSEVLHAAESQRYGNRDYEETYQQPTATIRAPHYTSKSEIDSHIQSLDRTVDNLQRGRPADRNSVVTPRPIVVDVDYDDDQQQVQQSFNSASSSAYAQQQSSRDILQAARPQPVGGYVSGSRGYQQGYSSSDASSRRGMLQSAASTVEGRAVAAPHGYHQVDQGAIDRSTYATSGRRGNAEELGQEASDLLGAAGAAKPGGSYRQESDDSMSYGYHRTGTFGADRSDGVRGTYARDGNVAATSKKAENMHEENGRVKFSAESSHSKHEEFSERRNFDFPAGAAVNQVSQDEIDRMSPDQKRAYWHQFGQRFNEFATKLNQQHGY